MKKTIWIIVIALIAWVVWRTFMPYSYSGVVAGFVGTALFVGISLYDLYKQSTGRALFDLIVALLFGLQATKDLSQIKSSEAQQRQLDAASLALNSATNEVHALSNKLEAITLPRMITEEQKAHFELLTQSITKIPIPIYVSQYGEDTESFGSQIRDMFTKAQFPIPPDVNTIGINEDQVFHLARKMAGSDTPPSVFIAYHDAPGVSNYLEIVPVVFEYLSNGEKRPKMMTNDVHGIYAAISFCLERVGVSTGWISNTNGVPPGKYVIVVPPKTL